MKECSKIFIVGLCMFLAGYLWGQKSAHTADILKIVSTTVPDTKSPRKLGSKINRTLDECDEHNLLVLGTGYSGTGYTSSLLDKAFVGIGHENNKRCGMVSWITTYAEDMVSKYRAIGMQIRDPLKVINSERHKWTKKGEPWPFKWRYADVEKETSEHYPSLAKIWHTPGMALDFKSMIWWIVYTEGAMKQSTMLFQLEEMQSLDHIADVLVCVQRQANIAMLGGKAWMSAVGHRRNIHNRIRPDGKQEMDELVEQVQDSPDRARLLARTLNLGLLFGYRWACSQETAEYLDSILLQRLHALAVRLGVHGGEGKGQGGGGVEAEGERKGEGDREFAVVEGTQLYAEGELDPLEEEVRVPIKVCSCVEYFKAITPNARISSLYHEKLGEFLDEGGFVGQLDQDN